MPQAEGVACAESLNGEDGEAGTEGGLCPEQRVWELRARPG
jgi:hypothetical protein